MPSNRRPYTVEIGMDALVRRADGSTINFGDAIYHPENAEEARQFAAAAEAGHRTKETHDCFLMNCRDLGPEVESLQGQLARIKETTP